MNASDPLSYASLSQLHLIHADKEIFQLVLKEL